VMPGVIETSGSRYRACTHCLCSAQALHMWCYWAGLLLRRHVHMPGTAHMPGFLVVDWHLFVVHRLDAQQSHYVL
jgi:hypothetical protein